MTCYRPIAALKPRDGGRVHILGPKFDKDGSTLAPKVAAKLTEFHDCEFVTFPCRRCGGCRDRYVSDWAIRFYHESLMHESNCVLTLTYDDEHLRSRSLVYSHVQDAYKRMRHLLGPFRHGTAGEYGSQNLRPHWHACICGVNFPDLEPAGKAADGSPLFTSELLESRVWPHGFANVGMLTPSSAAYVSGYCFKKQYGDDAERRYLVCDPATGEAEVLEPEMFHCSTRPAIGYRFLQKFRGDILAADGKVVIDGVKRPLPVAYMRWFEAQPDFYSDVLKSDAFKFAKANEWNATEDRLRVRAECAKARRSLKARSL